MELELFDYHLPEESIAQEPLEPKEEAKLMLVDRRSKRLEDRKIKDLVEILGENDVLVFNRTKVIPAKLFGEKTTGGKVELLLVREMAEDTWEALSRPGLKEGQKVNFGPLMALVVGREDDLVKLKFNYSGEYLLSRIFDLGKTPLPPYIKSSKSEREWRRIYQTIYAKDDGSIAAPPAGFHFSEKLIRKLTSRGVGMEYLTLHVGLGTFRPVKSAQIEDHKMHSERFNLEKETCDRLNLAKREGKRVIAVGTTTCRVLESQSDEEGVLTPGQGETKIFIYPPYKFKFVDGMLTNFHLPKTTLLMLVSALVSAPNTKTAFKSFAENLMGKAYQKAIKGGYRFFSFGDAMLIL